MFNTVILGPCKAPRFKQCTSILDYLTAIAFKELKTLLLALLPPTLFKIDKSVAFSVLSTGTIRLLPKRILGASAGTIRAVPDTVLKVPGPTPVLV